jgi:hypothetical protein
MGSFGINNQCHENHTTTTLLALKLLVSSTAEPGSTSWGFCSQEEEGDCCCNSNKMGSQKIPLVGLDDDETNGWMEKTSRPRRPSSNTIFPPKHKKSISHCLLRHASLETLGKYGSYNKLPKKPQIWHTFHMHKRKRSRKFFKFLIHYSQWKHHEWKNTLQKSFHHKMLTF